jgi:hypothetical protein
MATTTDYLYFGEMKHMRVIMTITYDEVPLHLFYYEDEGFFSLNLSCEKFMVNATDFVKRYNSHAPPDVTQSCLDNEENVEKLREFLITELQNNAVLKREDPWGCIVERMVNNMEETLNIILNQHSQRNED